MTRDEFDARFASTEQNWNVVQGERVVFTEEGDPQQYVKLIASGELDDTLLEALEDFVKRQRKRLGAARKPERITIVVNDAEAGEALLK